ncbi:MAG: tRNA methyl transferase PRC-barrel domain-containing protein, partial [Micromonosporaceae bacterium]
DKDQSYVLAVLTREQLSRAVFPLGDSTKTQVREEAAARGLAVADKPDSHDICFIADGDTRGFLAGQLGEQPGEIVDGVSGEVLGEHAGAYAYTVGQRKGLNIGRPAPDGKPRYVLSITPVNNQVTVGPAEMLDADQVRARRPVWTHGAAPDATWECQVQLRAHGEAVPATVTVDGEEVTARLARPVRGVAAGQALAFYRPDPAGDVVLGSAVITGSSVAAPLAQDTV